MLRLKLVDERGLDIGETIVSREEMTALYHFVNRSVSFSHRYPTERQALFNLLNLMRSADLCPSK